MAKEKEPITDVVFRVWTGEDHSVLALFPYIDNGQYNCSSYQHLGQHGGADYAGCIRRSRPAKPAEYADLKRELTQLGYRLRVIQRANNRLVRASREASR